MIKKNKKKQSNRIFAVLLAIVAMVSLFAVGVSADENECDHSWGISDPKGDEATIKVSCNYCDESYIVVPDWGVVDGLESECGTALKIGYVDYVIPEYDGYFLLSLGYYCSCGDDHISCVEISMHPFVDNPETNVGSLIGSMITTITDGVGGMLVGVGSAIVDFFNVSVLTADGNLTTFATWALAFLGIVFAIGVVKFITYLVKRR